MSVAAGSGQAAEGLHEDRGGFTETFTAFDGDAWHKANYVFSHPHFDTDWRADHALTGDGLTLILSPQEGENRFAGASVRRVDPTHFGRYEAELTAARGPGIITGFFLYSGPAYGTQHDEIDWEIFGQDTTTAQVAWWQDGVLRSKKIALGFDAAESANLYTIDWAPERIRWYVNGALVHEAREGIPLTPQRLFANVWAVDPGLANWAGIAELGQGAEAKARVLRHEPAAR